MSVFISTGAFKSRDINIVLNEAKKYEIHNIELSPGLDYDTHTIEYVKDCSDYFSYLIHNYFPTPLKPFALNLASSDEAITERSIEMCYNNIDLASELDIGYYSIHCGFCFDTNGKDLGSKSQIFLPNISIDKAKRTFVDNIRQICDYAYEKGVLVAIENNVVAEYAAKNKDLYLGVTADDILELIDLIDRDNLKVLLDLAHAKVSANTLGFDLIRMVESVFDYVVELHISENDGQNDQNAPLSRDSDLLEIIKHNKMCNITLEVYNLSPEEIIEQIQIVEEITA